LTKPDEDYIYGPDGKPMLMGGEPMKQSMYDDVRDSHLDDLRMLAVKVNIEAE